jgi:hypothetical protein
MPPATDKRAPVRRISTGLNIAPRNNSPVNSKPNGLFVAVFAAGIAAKLPGATCGHDYDMDPWQFVANLADREDKVYAGTGRCLILAGRASGRA